MARTPDESDKPKKSLPVRKTPPPPKEASGKTPPTPGQSLPIHQPPPPKEAAKKTPSKSGKSFPVKKAPPPPQEVGKTPPKRPAKRKADTNETADEFSFAVATDAPSTSAALLDRRKRSSASTATFLVFGGLAAVVLGGFLAYTLLGGSSTTFAILPIEKQSITELEPFELVVELDASDSAKGKLRYSLKDEPAGAAIDPDTGLFAWKPDESQGPKSHEMTVVVTDPDNPELEQTALLAIDVAEANVPPVVDPIEKKTVAADEVLEFTVSASDADAPSQKLLYSLGPGAPSGASIDAASGQFTWNPGNAEPGNDYHFRIRVTDGVEGSKPVTRGFDVRLNPAEPVDQVASVPVETPKISTPVEKPIPVDIPKPQASPYDKAKEKLLVLYKGKPEEKEDEEAEAKKKVPVVRTKKKQEKEKGTLFNRQTYPELRKIFADLFQQQHQSEMKQAFGADHKEMTAWLDEHVELKEELFTAIDPEKDNVVAALKLFNDIRKKYPEKIVPYGELAIATAVVWDNPERSVYDYHRHATRAKTTIPTNQLNALENFQYLVETESMMQGRVRFLPWEFLMLTVNHNTPFEERKWAMANYWAKREMYGKCYHDVPYDTLMLQTKSQQARLNGQVYNFPNLTKFGGVCAHQADYASRVGKSIGIPAAYITGESTYGELHAWVMWVELKGVAQNKISFSLQSYGRYRYDKYYIGHLNDPQTGEEITDRQLELRLQTVGLDSLAKRQSGLVMKAYPMLVGETEAELTEQLKYLFKVTDLCPGNQECWRKLAAMSRDGKIKEKEEIQKMTKVVE